MIDPTRTFAVEPHLKEWYEVLMLYSFLSAAEKNAAALQIKPMEGTLKKVRKELQAEKARLDLQLNKPSAKANFQQSKQIRDLAEHFFKRLQNLNLYQLAFLIEALEQMAKNEVILLKDDQFKNAKKSEQALKEPAIFIIGKTLEQAHAHIDKLPIENQGQYIATTPIRFEAINALAIQGKLIAAKVVIMKGVQTDVFTANGLLSVISS